MKKVERNRKQRSKRVRTHGTSHIVAIKILVIGKIQKSTFLKAAFKNAEICMHKKYKVIYEMQKVNINVL